MNTLKRKRLYPKHKLTIVLPISVRSGNKLLKQRWFHYYNYKKKIMNLMNLLLRANNGSYYNFINIIVYKKRKLDYDNMVTGLKPVVDALRVRGYIYDDDERSVKINYYQKETTQDEKIVIKLERNNRDEEKIYRRRQMG